MARNWEREDVHPVVATLPLRVHSVRVSISYVNTLQKLSYCRTILVGKVPVLDGTV
jgi:hypothetical protein